MFKENKKARYSTLCIEKHLQLHLFFFFWKDKQEFDGDVCLGKDLGATGVPTSYLYSLFF